jgi:conjugative transfer region lipoprotein (TIGR03751 family)
MRIHMISWLLVWISVLAGCAGNVIRDRQPAHAPTMVDIYRQHQKGLGKPLADLRAQVPPVKAVRSDEVDVSSSDVALPEQLPNPVLPLYVYEHVAYTIDDEALVIPTYVTAFSFYRQAPFALTHERG